MKYLSSDKDQWSTWTLNLHEISWIHELHESHRQNAITERSQAQNTHGRIPFILLFHNRQGWRMECGDAYLGVVTIATAQQAQEVVMVNVKKGPPTCVGALEVLWVFWERSTSWRRWWFLSRCCRTIHSSEQACLMHFSVYILQHNKFKKGRGIWGGHWKCQLKKYAQPVKLRVKFYWGQN